MCSWYKLEFESCPALLNEVEDQFEKNAEKVTSISVFCLIFTQHASMHVLLGLSLSARLHSTSVAGKQKACCHNYAEKVIVMM